MDQIIQKAADILLSNGLAGIAIIGLVYLVYMMRSELKDTRIAYEIRLVEKDKLIYQTQEARVVEARAGYEVIASISKTQDAIIGAIRKG